MFKLGFRFLSILLLMLFSSLAIADDVLPSSTDVQAQIDAVEKSDKKEPDSELLLTNLRDTLALLAQIAQQENAITELRKTVNQADSLIQTSQNNLNQINDQPKPDDVAQQWENKSLDELTALQASNDATLQQIQTQLTNLNTQLVAQRSAPERIQSALTDNLARTQQLNKLMFSAQVSASLRDKYKAELKLIDLRNQYNQLSLNGGSRLTSLYESQIAEKTAEQQYIQAIQTRLVQKISEMRLALSQQQVAQLEQSSDNNLANPLIKSELALNSKLSQELLDQTNTNNQLVQDGLRIRNTLDNLIQTQRNLEEQISALQGTLLLSRVINKQRHSLPSDSLISDLPNRITQLRVMLFDVNEKRDEVFNPAHYIENLENEQHTQFSAVEKKQLTTILQDRRKLLTDIITQLNEQLNHAINIELNQQQVVSISNELQNKLEQQSFWVRSNIPVDWTWFKTLPQMASAQIKQIVSLMGFSHWREHITAVLLLLLVLLTPVFLINWRKEWIKKRITFHNSQVNTLNGDSLWRTVMVLLYTIILALPSTLIFLSSLILILFFMFKTPLVYLLWALKMALFWLFFAFMLALLRPNGISYRHFNFSQTTNELFRNTLKRSIPILVVLLNASIFTGLEDTGVTNDYLGETMIMVALLIFLFQIRPAFSTAVKHMQTDHQNSREQTNYTTVLRIFSVLLVLIPITLMVLIILGYYYTALILIKYITYTYVVTILWFYLREIVHRAIRVSARKLAYRRLKEKRERERELQEQETRGEEFMVDAQEEQIAIATVNQQISQVSDIVMWILLVGLLYWVWSDLLSVAYYLDGISLWQQTSTGENGTTELESITLLNLLSSFLILWGTYLVVRNLSGVLEILVFSRIRLSQGAPYAITTILSYLIIALGAGSAFSSLGMSWSKLQWLFAALSVGLGFGLQEIFANFVSGIIILFERPVRIGDIITIDSFSGTVSKIRIRATTIVDFDGKEVIVPNKTFVTERLTNWSLSSTVTRIVIEVGVAYGSDLELTRDLLLQAADEAPHALKEPSPSVYFLTFGASTLDHELRVYVSQTEYRNPTIDFLNRRIDELFKQHNIEIAFNQLDVYIKNLADGKQLKLDHQALANENVAKNVSAVEGKSAVQRPKIKRKPALIKEYEEHHRDDDDMDFDGDDDH
ncbi:mechanosensitive channel MscK [Pasteurellaceae bacterium NCTC 11878]|uniref:mechanosensitive channel MscK n=1 Tax=Spirabiliibacterium falconis TaxID=572023 RepID=UPI001AAD4E52|nr:mechanosensitive channel MscK [Spirabiliibacterium falconis]MBE2893736.1 mechanosensitive channel MscK [Spirabiliibacterium falconis]